MFSLKKNILIAMINFNTIRQNIVNMEYGWKKPQSLIILIPGLSLIFQKIQVSHLINTLEANYQSPYPFLSIIHTPEYIKLDTVYQWHAVGSLIQTISLLAIGILLNPIFLLPAVLSAYEMYISVTHLTHEFEIRGNQLRFIR